MGESLGVFQYKQESEIAVNVISNSFQKNSKSILNALREEIDLPFRTRNYFKFLFLKDLRQLVEIIYK